MIVISVPISVLTKKDFYKPTLAKYRVTDPGYMTQCFKQRFRFFHNSDDTTWVWCTCFPISQQHSLLVDKCWLFPWCLCCEHRLCDDIFTTVVEVVWSVLGSLKLWDFGDKEESPHNRLSAVPSGNTNHAFALWPLLNSAQQLYVFKGVCVMWEADLSSNQTVRTQHPTPFYWLYCIQHFLYDTLANSLKFDCFISKYAHATSIYSARWS